MNPQDPLAELLPLREPVEIGWWPLAPGWWLLLASVLLILAVLAWFLWRRYRANAYRRNALRQLQALRDGYLQDNDCSQYVRASNALLKSVALLSYPAEQVASRSGDDWWRFLDQTVAGGCSFPPGMAAMLYQRSSPDFDEEQMYASASTWIKKHGASQ